MCDAGFSVHVVDWFKSYFSRTQIVKYGDSNSFKLSKNDVNIVIPARNTRLHQKKNFRVDRKVGTKYSRSPFYNGTKLWDKLTKEEQESSTLKCLFLKNTTSL